MNELSTNKTYELNKNSKKNLNKDLMYKILLYGLTILIIGVVLISVIFVLVSGVSTSIDANLSIGQLLFGNKYSPLTANTLAAGFIVVNTVWMAILALCIAVPISIGTALIITRILPRTLSTVMYAIVAILAAIPSVVYGMFGYSIINDFLMMLGITTGSLLSVLLTTSFMIVPTITIMTIASIRMTDKKLEESSYALGTTKTQTSFYITLRTAKAGILTGIIFAVGRCLGETTAISMISPTASFYDGVVLSPLSASLFLGPAILGLMPGGETTLDIYLFPVISAFLLMTSMLIFGSLKYVEFMTNDSNVSKKHSKSINEVLKIKAKLNDEGIASLSLKEQKVLYKYDRNAELNLSKHHYTIEDYAVGELKKSSISDVIRIEKYKKRKTLQHNLFIYIASSIGIILLLSIFIFLFDGGFRFLNWDMLTSRDFYGDPANKMFGLAVPMLGTLITILISLSIAIPIGAALGLFVSVYIRRDTKFGFIVTLFLQILTSIPTIVWSTIAALVFMGTSFDDDFKGFEPAIFMGIILLPIIIKTTEDSANRVKNNLMEGSASLGATKLKSTGSIVLKESFPAIIAASLLGVSTVLAESTIFVSLLDTSTESHMDIDSWINNGGYSLAATIWKLNDVAKANFNNIERYSMIMDEIKTIGLLLMAIIFVMSISSVLFTNKKYISASLLLLTILSFVIGAYIYYDNNTLSILLETVALSSLVLSIILIVIPTIIRRR